MSSVFNLLLPSLLCLPYLSFGWSKPPTVSGQEQDSLLGPSVPVPTGPAPGGLGPSTVCRQESKGAPCSIALDIFYYSIASQRAVTSNQHVPELCAEVSLPSQAPWFGSLLCLTGLAQPSSCRTQSYTLHSFSHVCTLILHCCS